MIWSENSQTDCSTCDTDYGRLALFRTFLLADEDHDEQCSEYEIKPLGIK